MASITALQVCAAAYRQANLDQDLVAFGTTQEFPYNIALDILQTVIQEINRKGLYWGAQMRDILVFSPGIYQYDLSSYFINPSRIMRLRTEVTGACAELTQYNWRQFQTTYRVSPLSTQRPTAWAKYGSTLELNTIPDKNYQITVYHYKDMPLPQAVQDTFVIPDSDMDVVREGVFAYLLHRMGRGDALDIYRLFQAKLETLLANQEQDAGLPRQMPAAF